MSAPLIAPNPMVASSAIPFALVNTTVKCVLSVTLAEAMSASAKLTFAVVALSPLMSQDSLVQSRRAWMSVAAVSPLANRLLKLVPIKTRVSVELS